MLNEAQRMGRPAEFQEEVGRQLHPDLQQANILSDAARQASDMGWIRTEIYDSLVPGWSVVGLSTWCQDRQGACGYRRSSEHHHLPDRLDCHGRHSRRDRWDRHCLRDQRDRPDRRGLRLTQSSQAGGLPPGVAAY